MAWPKGKTRGKKTEGSGRQKGAQNKITVSVRQAFKDAFDHLQNDPVANLKAWGSLNPKEFYAIAQKLIPQEISGPEGGAIPHEVAIKFVKPQDK